MAYLLSNICTKNYWNQTNIVEIIVGGWVVCSFLRHSVVAVHKAYEQDFIVKCTAGNM